ncbi:MAG TPA: peptidoglycan DD-metalloendopeptidase family protein [Cyclobacteriaceae bacterium]|nr:peptidoglycan DD-metalloendopeptidase family protein [Cyclobacteriaceae bacterium]
MNGLKSPWIRKTVCTLTLAGFLIVSFFVLDNGTSLFSRQGDYASADTVKRVETEVQKPILMFGMVVNDLHVAEDQVRRNQRFADLLEGHYVAPAIQQQLNLLPRKIFDFRKISAGKKYTLITLKDSLQTVRELIYEPNPIDYVVFRLSDSLRVEVCQREVKTVEKNVTGEIQFSLSETIEQLGISHELTNKFVDIFAWQVDFQHLQRGDKFKLIYEENLVEDRPISVGKILGIYFEHFGNGYYAFPFDQGNGLDYYDEAGKSLRKALLKYPIEFTRISSRYSLSRFHPVVKVFRAHLGTDFAAPTGTPIRSVGDGVVTEAQYKANNGNYVKIHHNGTYSTAYLHMSRIGAGIATGVRVRQGQTIGYVGSTGLATGPHVCYRFWRNGVQVDALRIELPPSQPIRKENLEEFQIIKEALINRLNLIPFPPAAPDVIVAGR